MKGLVQKASRTAISQLRFGCWFMPFTLVLQIGMIDCSAQGTVYTDRSLFNAALQSSFTATFETLSPSSSSSIGISPVFDFGISITNSEHRLFVCKSPPGLYLYPIPGDGQYIWNFDSSYPVGIFLPNGMNAFGADFSGGINPGSFNATLTVNLVGGQSFSYNFTGQQGSWTFFGVGFSQPISSLVYHDGGILFPGNHEEMLDNVTFGVVPEPQALTIALCTFTIWLLSRPSRHRVQPRG